MNHIDTKIEYLQSLGINFNLSEGREWLLSNLEQYHNIDDKDYPLWLILREFGNTFIVSSSHKAFSNNTSTIIFEDFFLYNKLSRILSELQRISNGAISYKVIHEFEPVYNTDHSRSSESIWGEYKSTSPIKCTYEICGQIMAFDYNFLDGQPTILNSEFVDQLCSKLDVVFLDNNINYLYEESITFFRTSQENQETLYSIPTLHLNKNLVRKYRKTNHQTTLPITDALHYSHNESKYVWSKVDNTRIATPTEIRKLQEYKKSKTTEFILVVMLCLAIGALIIWLSHFEMLNNSIGKLVLYPILILLAAAIVFVYIQLKLKAIKADLQEKHIKRLKGVVLEIFRYDGKTIIEMNKECDVKKLIIDRNIRDVQEGNEITFEVFKASKVFSKLIDVNSLGFRTK